MKPSLLPASQVRGPDPLDLYVKQMARVRSRLDHIVANQEAMAASLSRAAAALRSLAARRPAGSAGGTAPPPHSPKSSSLAVRSPMCVLFPG